MINLLEYDFLKISEQLKIEKDLLKNSHDNFCIINAGSSPAIVLGILNEEKKWLLNFSKNEKIDILKRFSGGGTVYVDENTIFVSFIFSKDFLNIELFPEKIMKWAEAFYKDALKIDGFCLIENDFVINNKKVAGNAQYIKKDRFILHSSFLWDYNIEKMNSFLSFPPKVPSYRNTRNHEEFLTSLKIHFDKKADFLSKIKREIKNLSLNKPLHI
ncbi:MAG: lipoate--protein ligase family protein [Parachlamydiales bacterium]|nr:lipoate--protein ligase family protein [Parachlamydiales bacterium]